MSSFEHSRFRIFNPAQHPYRHSYTDFSYVNPRLPGVSNPSDALDYVIAVLYPKYIGTYANQAALPVSASNNDYAIVSDDGSGHAAGYVWTVIDGASGWNKRYDMTWSMESILAETVGRTEYMYPAKYGADDLDSSGTTIAGTFAGQRIYGGKSASTNLTLSANSGNTLGAHSGYLQFDDQVRPTVDNTFSLGTSVLRFSNIYSLLGTYGTLTIQSGQINDSGGTISFGANALTTTGLITGGSLSVSGAGALSGFSFSTGSSPTRGLLTHTSGAIDISVDTLTTTGTITGASGSQFGHLTLSNGSITDTSGSISFGSNNLSTSGTLTGGSTSGGNLTLSGNVISSTNTNGAITLTPNGAGTVTISSALSVTGSYTSTSGNLTLTNGSLSVGNIQVSANTISSTNTNGNIVLSPNGVGLISAGAGIYPSTSASFDSGKSGNLWNNVWISNAIKNATNTFLISDLMILRNIAWRDAGRSQSAQNGDGLFYDSTSGTWLAQAPASEILHSNLTGLTTGDAGHTQFLLLAGRSGGQSVQGGTAASDNLNLESTSNVTKGNIQVKDPLIPFTNASYSSSWSGTDLGGSSNYFRDVYTKGEHKGFRFENVTSGALPTSSAQNKGRTVFSTDNNKLYVDTGSAFVETGISKYLGDISFNGSVTQVDTNVSASVNDARNCVWALHDNANSYERIYCQIQATSASNVRVISSPALPAGSYRLIGVE